jgi:hypothetical protein
LDPVLQSLIRYQEISLELSRLKASLEQFPAQIKLIDDGLKAASASVTAARAAILDHQKDRRRLEMELQDHEVKLRKYNEQLMQVKTNTEYKAMQAEIAGVKEKIGGVETQILLLMDEAESAEGKVKEEERALGDRRKEADARKAAVLQEEARLNHEASQAESQLQAARAGLGPDVIDLFNRIASTRNGVAVARARDERCQGCNVRIRPQNFQDVRRNDRIIQCDSCLRILYYVPEPPAADGTGTGDGTPAPDGPAA